MGFLPSFVSVTVFLTLSTRSATAQLITTCESCKDLQIPGIVPPPNGTFNRPTIHVSSTDYRVESSFQVTIGFSPGSFQELICKGRQTRGGYFPVGTFTSFTSDYELYKCRMGAGGSAIGTKNKCPKHESTVEFTYVAPDPFLGDIQIRCSFVISGNFGFIDVASPVVIAVTPCDSNPCQNGATCKRFGNDFNCICVDGFGGFMCEKWVGVCTPGFCQKNGRCMNSFYGPYCNCHRGFAGPFCAQTVLLVRELPDGIFYYPGRGHYHYPDNVNVSFIVQGPRHQKLLLQMIDVEVSAGDVLRIGPGRRVDSYAFHISFTSKEIINVIPHEWYWITFTPNNDGNTGRGFILHFRYQ